MTIEQIMMISRISMLAALILFAISGILYIKFDIRTAWYVVTKRPIPGKGMLRSKKEKIEKISVVEGFEDPGETCDLKTIALTELMAGEETQLIESEDQILQSITYNC